MNAFLFGSHAYGTPTEKSDVDLCVPISLDDLLRFKAALARYGITAQGPSIKIGPLNLICITSDKTCEAWHKVTKELEARRPVTREEACGLLDRAIGYR
jgi:hypothetical protein